MRTKFEPGVFEMGEHNTISFTKRNLSVLIPKCDHSARNGNYVSLEVFQIDIKIQDINISSLSEYNNDIF